jgi:hypothetical protein
VAARIHIDRRRHLELAWERQQARERLLAEPPPKDRVLEVCCASLCIFALYCVCVCRCCCLVQVAECSNGLQLQRQVAGALAPAYTASP